MKKKNFFFDVTFFVLNKKVEKWWKLWKKLREKISRILKKKRRAKEFNNLFEKLYNLQFKIMRHTRRNFFFQVETFFSSLNDCCITQTGKIWEKK